jgi:hypothetical protein
MIAADFAIRRVLSGAGEVDFTKNSGNSGNTLIVLWEGGGGGISIEQKTFAAFLLTALPHVLV